MNRFPFAGMALALIAAPALPAHPADLVLDLGGNWRCVRTDSRGYIHECKMRLTVDAEDRIEGRIEWTLLRSTQSEHRTKLGSTAVEYVRGRITSPESLFFGGHAKDDPQDTIALDIYPMQLSPGGDWMFGRTESQGAWTSQFCATCLQTANW
jgi:hypothetical protein